MYERAVKEGKLNTNVFVEAQIEIHCYGSNENLK